MYEEMLVSVLLPGILRIVLFVSIGYFIGKRKAKKEMIKEELEISNRNLAIENARLLYELNTLKERNADAE